MAKPLIFGTSIVLRSALRHLDPRYLNNPTYVRAEDTRQAVSLIRVLGDKYENQLADRFDDQLKKDPQATAARLGA
jgi:hypothetical protein